MRSIRVLICQVDDGAPDLMNELACFDLATPAVAALQPETALDALEATTQDTGTTILRRLLHAQWDEIDAALVARHCAQRAPAVVHQDGQETVTVASRFGLLHLARQVCVGLSTLFEGESPLRATMIVGSGLGTALNRRSSRTTRRRTILLRRDVLDLTCAIRCIALAARLRPLNARAELRAKTRRSTPDGPTLGGEGRATDARAARGSSTAAGLCRGDRHA